MSNLILNDILKDMGITPTENEIEILDEKLADEFGLIGFNHCDELETYYESDPEGVKEYILSILKKHGKKEIEPIKTR